MRYGRANLHWYDIIFFGLAAVIVFPDKILDWLSEQTGREFGWWHIVWLEMIAVGSAIIAVALLMPMYSRLDWWYPLVAVAALALVRGIRRLIVGFFGFPDP